MGRPSNFSKLSLSFNKPNGNKPNGNKPNGDKPNGDKPNGDKPSDKKARVTMVRADWCGFCKKVEPIVLGSCLENRV